MFWFKKGEKSEKKLQNAKIWILLAVAAVGVGLLLVGGKETKTEKSGETELSDHDELIAYQTYLEERIKNLCESVSGVDRVTAVVTLSGGFESVYATEYSEGNEEYVILGSGASASGLFLSRTAPTVVGVGIVCRGGGSADVQGELTSLISATLHIPSNRIYITEAGK